MGKVEFELGFDRGIKMEEGSGLLFLGGSPGAQTLGWKSQNVDCKEMAKCECRVYVEQVKVFLVFTLNNSGNLVQCPILYLLPLV